jgi:O-antigen/teichoic acid export membrane protein
MAWLVGGILDLVAVNMAISLTVEGSFDTSSLADHCRRALKKIGLLIVPAAGLIALLAPWGLGLFGPGYAREGAPILQLLALATLPKTLTEVYLGALRAQSRTRMVAIVQGIRATIMLGLTVWLVETMGLIGAGVAAVVTQVVVAAMISPALWRVLHGDRAPAAERAIDPVVAAADAGVIAPEGSTP